MDIDASIATLRPKRVLMSCSTIAFGACSEMSAVNPLIPIANADAVG